MAQAGDNAEYGGIEGRRIPGTCHRGWHFSEGFSWTILNKDFNKLMPHAMSTVHLPVCFNVETNRTANFHQPSPRRVRACRSLHLRSRRTTSINPHSISSIKLLFPHVAMPATVTPKPRRIGLSKRDQPIWGHQLQTLPCVRPATPENVAAPPQGSSEEELVIEASGDESSEFDYTRPTKRRRQNNDEVGTMTRKSTSSPAVDESATGALACEPSNIAPSSFTRQSENSDEDELFKSSRTKRGKTYVRAINNIHTSRPNGQGKETKKDLRSTRIRKGSGFIKSDTGRLLSQGRSRDLSALEYDALIHRQLTNMKARKRTPSNSHLSP